MATRVASPPPIGMTIVRTYLGIIMALLAGSAGLCRDAKPDRDRAAGPTVRDLVEMQSIDSLLISPDGKRLAFRVISPSVSTDRVISRWYWTDLGDRAGPPQALGQPSAPIRGPMFDTIEDGQAQWSESGSMLYVLELSGDHVAVHGIGPRGHDEVAAGGAADIESFHILPGGHQIQLTMRAARAAIDAAQLQEAREGIHFDRAVSAEGSRLTRNFQIGTRWTTWRYLDDGQLGEGAAGPKRETTRPITEPQGSHPQPPALGATLLSGADPSVASQLLTSARQLTVRLVQTDPGKPFLSEPSYQLVASQKGTAPIACRAFFCNGRSSALREIAYDDATGEAVIAYEADYSARTALYGWNAVTGRTRTIREADGSLSAGSSYSAAPCPTAGRYLYCVSAGPAAPPRLVRIDMATGATRTLFDPNRALAARQYGLTKFLRWTDKQGDPFTGVLVLPREGSGPFPLVITSYRCRGYLRGGVVPLAPEYVLAERGIAALCVNHNNALGITVDANGKVATLAPHKAAISGYESIIAQLAQQRLIDPARVGISGHSFSSMVAAYAISHTDLFKTAVLGTGVTIDPATYLFSEPTTDSWRKGILKVLNMPNPFDDDGHQWADVSPALNAARIHASLLIQPPEDEYLLALQLFAAMRHAGDAVDMYVYPDEGHLMTRHPVHQLYRLSRSVAWFSCWLKDDGAATAADRRQCAYWKSLGGNHLKT